MDIESISIHRYHLKPKAQPNRVSQDNSRSGALLQVKFKGLAKPGYSDLFTWPELGDEPLEQQLSTLKEGITYRQTAASLSWAHFEAQAKAEQESLLSASGVRCHQTVWNREDLSSAFTTYKLKITNSDIHHPQALIDLLQAHPQKRWRLDFNHLFSSHEQLHSFLELISTKLVSRIDFLEDPFTPSLMEDSHTYQQGFPPIAVDRYPTPKALEVADMWVLKPVYFSPNYLMQKLDHYPKSVVVTSNMDHPLGQLIALYTAQQLPQRSLCGLMTQDFYHPHAQSHWLKAKGDLIQPNFVGPGWGLDAELEKLAWETLC